MLSRDSYPSNIASLLLSWPYLCLLLASLKAIKIKAHTGNWDCTSIEAISCGDKPDSSFPYAADAFDVHWTLCSQTAYLSLDLATLSSRLFSSLYLQTLVWQMEGKKTLLVCGNCGSLLFLENRSERRRTHEDPAWLEGCHSSWNINILPQKDVTSIWKQTSSFRITMGRSVAQ